MQEKSIQCYVVLLFGCQAVFWTSGDLTELCSQLWISIIMTSWYPWNHGFHGIYPFIKPQDRDLGWACLICWSGSGYADSITGDPLHSRAACTQPCNVNTHSRAHCSPGARLCEQWGHGCVNNEARLCASARLCRGSPVSISWSSLIACPDWVQVAPTLTFTIIVGATPLWISTPCYCHFVVRASGPNFLLYNVPPPPSVIFYTLGFTNKQPPPPPPIIIFIVGLVAPTSLSAIWCHSPPPPTPPVIFVHT